MRTLFLLTPVLHVETQKATAFPKWKDNDSLWYIIISFWFCALESADHPERDTQQHDGLFFHFR